MSLITELSDVKGALAQVKEKVTELRGIFDVDKKSKRLDELENAAQNPAIWENHLEMQKINREKALIEKSIGDWRELQQMTADTAVLIEMANEAQDEDTFLEAKTEITKMRSRVEELELKSLLSGPLDSGGAYISVNSGAGGTEAQDWASILLRMYQRYAEDQGYKIEVMSINEGEEAGIKSVTLLIDGPYAFGNLRCESGVHRLVRISPFDSNARRHTSFASVLVWPDVNEDIDIVVKDDEIRVDTYRSSGAGGQHVNKTDSAVRITHIATGIVVQCQNERSQHSNRDKAMKMLKSALYEVERERLERERAAIAGEKKANEWGSQIRSYVLHPYQLVKDHRTDFESGNPSAVLGGELSGFIQAYLKEQALIAKSKD